jgi:hypothetical protein
VIQKSLSRRAMRLLAVGAAIGVGTYALYATLAWHRYGHTPPADHDERDELLDRFMPVYDVVERHHIRVAAPAAIALQAATEQDLLDSAVARAIFKTREMVMRAKADDCKQPRGLLAAVTALGWGVLAEVPGREIVVGAVTKPWEGNVTFRALPPDQFASFAQPGFVKIAWTLRADPLADDASVFRTETRAVATDPTARTRFRRYWAFASPGIALIRYLSLLPLRRDAEQRASALEGELRCCSTNCCLSTTCRTA